MKVPNDTMPVAYGINRRVVRGKAGLEEQVYKVGGLYSSALTEVNKWLTLAAGVAENEPQKKAILLLTEYYATGDLKKWDEFNIAWVKATEGDIDFINGFVEMYRDPMGLKGSFESCVEINDFEASSRMAAVSANAQWFEDNSPVLPQHKKAVVKGITYKVVSTAGIAGDMSPITAIGVNLPNSEWIRKDPGSKSVSLGNIEDAYGKADGPGILQEYSHDEEEVARFKEFGSIAGKMHTALHEVLGHASGQIEKDKDIQLLKNYYSPLEEARADLFALYYIMDQKLVDLKLMPSIEVGKAEYDQYIKNGMMLQLRRIKPGNDIEEAHMRNRQMIAKWAFEKGQKDNVISKVVKNGKTYFEINDYAKLRDLFGQLLREVQRIKSQADYTACKNLFETYGRTVDAAIHKEVLARAEALKMPPYGAFINPKYVLVQDAKGEITDIKIEYPDNFLKQMLEYGKLNSFL